MIEKAKESRRDPSSRKAPLRMTAKGRSRRISKESEALRYKIARRNTETTAGPCLRQAGLTRIRAKSGRGWVRDDRLKTRVRIPPFAKAAPFAKTPQGEQGKRAASKGKNKAKARSFDFAKRRSALPSALLRACGRMTQETSGQMQMQIPCPPATAGKRQAGSSLRLLAAPPSSLPVSGQAGQAGRFLGMTMEGKERAIRRYRGRWFSAQVRRMWAMTCSLPPFSWRMSC
jgi:hypothetical protein